MMFMIPIPPTTSDTAATPPSSVVIVVLTFETREMMSLLLRMVKSLAWLGLCAYTWFAPELFRRMLARSLGTVRLDPDF